MPDSLKDGNYDNYRFNNSTIICKYQYISNEIGKFNINNNDNYSISFNGKKYDEDLTRNYDISLSATCKDIIEYNSDINLTSNNIEIITPNVSEYIELSGVNGKNGHILVDYHIPVNYFEIKFSYGNESIISGITIIKQSNISQKTFEVNLWPNTLNRYYDDTIGDFLPLSAYYTATINGNNVPDFSKLKISSPNYRISEGINSNISGLIIFNIDEADDEEDESDSSNEFFEFRFHYPGYDTITSGITVYNHGFILYESSFPDVNGFYTNENIDHYNEYSTADELAEYLISQNEFDASALDGCGDLNYISFNGKCYILDGCLGCRIIPKGDSSTKWYYKGGGDGAVTIGEFYDYNEDEGGYPGKDLWDYNASFGIGNNPSQDWEVHNFPHIQYINN